MLFNSIGDENRYRKKEKALKKYFMRVYKYMIFKVLPTLRKENKKDGYYEVELPVNILFEKVYGKMLLKFYVEDDRAYFEDILPDNILIACYEKELPVYKGVPFETKKDFIKIKIMEILL